MDIIEQLIQKIESLQVKQTNDYYNKGMFPSQRSNKFLFYKREDSNIYYPALVTFTLLPLLEKCNTNHQKRLKKIIEGITQNYPSYSNPKDDLLINFYKTKPTDHFPNGYFFSKFKHFKLADDTDCTCIVGTNLQDQLNTNDVTHIRKELVQFANLSQKKIVYTFDKYKDLRGYGVWLGTGKMPVEFDLCVMANILFFTFQNNCTLNQQDLDSLSYIKTAILDNDIDYHPFEISYTYPSTIVMLYHIARLWSVMPFPEKYLPKKEIIVAKIDYYLNTSKNTLEKILLTSSLLKMEQQTIPINYQISEVEKEFAGFGFFRALMLKGTNNPLLNKLATYPLFQLLFDCDAYYYSLLLEYELLRKN